MIDLSGVIHIENMCASGINAYYEDGSNLYALYGEEFKVLPNTKHNQTFCFLSIQQKIDAIEQYVGSVNCLRRSFCPKDWWDYFLTVTYDDAGFLSYYRNIVFLRKHYETVAALEQEGKVGEVVDFVLTPDGLVTFQAHLSDKNILSLPMAEVGAVADTVKKKKCFTLRRER